jgi:hypothetical protein
MAIIWPQIVGGLYSDPTSMYAGYLNCVPGAMIVVGMVLGGMLAEPIGRTNYQVICAFCIGGALVACEFLSVDESNARMLTFLSLRCCQPGQQVHNDRPPVHRHILHRLERKRVFVMRRH